MQNYYKPGTWNVICDVCGRRLKSDEVRKRWDGFIVCVNDYETRHILDFFKVRPERPPVPYIREEPPDNFVVVNYIDTSGYVPPTPPVTPPPDVPPPTGDLTSRADIARADYAQADRAT